MKWLRYSHQGQVGLGQLVGDTLHVHQGSLFENPQPTGVSLPLSAVEVLAPCHPTKVLALWNNFKAAAEKNGWHAPTEPLYFLKSPNSYSHHLQAVIRPQQDVGRVVYEAELGIVIGKRGRDIPLAEAAHHIFGYTCVNDVTAVELLRSDTGFEQWTRAKNFDAVSDMFFSPQELVAKLSRGMTLEAGDMISCGTSLGAMPWQNDAVVEVAIEGIGTLSNTMKESA
jgi:2-keto-4-pentenoate hydratase/2-oxohepta-3-ene-1,7-dioic acid hydratase in catechol pathway